MLNMHWSTLKRHIRGIGVSVMLGSLSSCGDGVSPTQMDDPESVASSVTLSASTLITIPGDVEQLAASVHDQTGALMSGGAISWLSSNDQIASVSATGTVTALALGHATIRATSGDAFATATVEVSPFALAWSVETGGGPSSPAISEDGTVYVGSLDHGVYAVGPDGTLRWRFETGWAVPWAPAIGSDGTIYIGSGDGNLYALAPDGTPRWSYQVVSNQWFGTPSIASDGTIYIGLSIGAVGADDLMALNSNGTLKWSIDIGSSVLSSPALAADGTLYVGTGMASADSLGVKALNEDGTVVWGLKTGATVFSSPALGTDGTVYVGSDDGGVYALGADGSLKWRFETGARVQASPALGSDGTIYVGSQSERLYALNPDGTLQWAFSGGAFNSSPALAEDGTILVGSGDEYLYAINPAGALYWRFKADGGIQASPAIDSDGTVYISSIRSDGGTLYAIRTTTGGLARIGWPKYKRDNQNTGR
jgi:outer membrane protein assembly factor BamB